MSKLAFRSNALIALLVAGAAASAAACSKEEQKPWRCNNADVPMGEVTRCTQLALGDVSTGWDAVTAGYVVGQPVDGVVATEGTATGGSGTGATGTEPVGDTGISTTVDYPGWVPYVCVSGSTNPDCAGLDDSVIIASPEDTSVIVDTSTTGSGDSTGTGGAGTTSGGQTGGAPIGDTSSTGSDSTTGTGGAGTSTDGTSTDGTGGTGGKNGGSNNKDKGSSGKGPGPNGGTGGSSKVPGPDECDFVPDLPYCAGGGGASSSTTSSSSGSSGETSGSDDGKGGKGNGSSSSSGGSGNGQSSGAPGQDKKNGGSSGGSNNGKTWKCLKDDKGNKICESVPSCPPGSRPSNGACVENDVPAGSPSGETKPPSQGGCWITGGGFIVAPNDLTGAAPDGNGHDNFGGNAKGMKDGSVKGHWNHVDHGTQNHSKGRPSYIYCRHVNEPGPGQPGGKKGFTMNQAYFGGPAEWRDASTGAWASGYWFDVVVKDHGEPGSVPHAKNGGMVDTYHFTIRKMNDPVNKISGAVVYEVGRGGNKASGGLVGGNIQLHPPNGGHPYTPGPLPAWVNLED